MWPVLRNQIFKSSLSSFGAELFTKWSFFVMKLLFSSVSPMMNITATLYQSHCLNNIFFLIFFKGLCIIRAWSLFCSIQIYVSQHILHILLKKLAFPFSVLIFFVCSVLNSISSLQNFYVIFMQFLFL